MKIILTDIAPLHLNVDAEGLRSVPAPAAPVLNIEEHLDLEAVGFRVAVNSPSLEVRCVAVYQYLLRSDDGVRALIDIDMSYLASFDLISDMPVDLVEIGSNPEKMRTLLDFTEQAVRFKIGTILNQFGIRTRYPLAAFDVDL